jgi:hypothetical protein
MKIFYRIGILAQLVMSFLFRKESKAAYMLYLWKDLSGRRGQVRSPHIKSTRVSKYKETKSAASEHEYSFFVEP